MGGFANSSATLAWAEEAFVPRQQFRPPGRRFTAQMGAFEPQPVCACLISVVYSLWCRGLGTAVLLQGWHSGKPPQGVVGSTFEKTGTSLVTGRPRCE